MSTEPRIVVFGDADGVLFPGAGRCLPGARAAIARLEGQGASLVLCSEATRAEIERHQQQLGLREPLVAERGAAAFIPRNYTGLAVPGARQSAGYDVLEFAAPYDEVVAALRAASRRAGIRTVGYSDMSVEEVASESGLPLLDARLAKLREYVEPFRILDDSAAARHRLSRVLSAVGLHSVARGRYDHLGTSASIAPAVEALRAFYRRVFGPIVTIGIAHAFTGEHLLRGMDHKIIMHHDPASLRRDPARWVERIAGFVDDLRGRGDFSRGERRCGRPAAEHAATRARWEREWVAELQRRRRSAW